MKKRSRSVKTLIENAARRAAALGMSPERFREACELAITVADMPHLPAQVAVANITGRLEDHGKLCAICAERPSELPVLGFCKCCAPDEMFAEALWTAAKDAAVLGVSFERFRGWCDRAMDVRLRRRAARTGKRGDVGELLAADLAWEIGLDLSDAPPVKRA